MGLVLWIDHNGFVANLVDRVFKKKGLEFYTLSQVDDFIYLINDLKPSVVVINAETVLANVDIFRNQYLSSLALQRTPIILTNPQPGLEFIGNIIGELTVPIDPFKVPQQITQLLKAN